MGGDGANPETKGGAVSAAIESKLFRGLKSIVHAEAASNNCAHERPSR
jgi:hypothetical protein